jgi:hypothetical protein
MRKAAIPGGGGVADYFQLLLDMPVLFLTLLRRNNIIIRTFYYQQPTPLPLPQNETLRLSKTTRLLLVEAKNARLLLAGTGRRGGKKRLWHYRMLRLFSTVQKVGEEGRREGGREGGRHYLYLICRLVERGGYELCLSIGGFRRENTV